MSKKQKGLNPELESAVELLLKQVMADDTASLTDKCKVIDRMVNIEKLKQKISDDEWGSGFMNTDDNDEQGYTMIFRFKGDKNGCSSLGTPSFGGHYRPFNHNFGALSIERDVRVDNVESHVGASGNTSNICRIQLSCR